LTYIEVKKKKTKYYSKDEFIIILADNDLSGNRWDELFDNGSREIINDIAKRFNLRFSIPLTIVEMFVTNSQFINFIFIGGFNVQYCTFLGNTWEGVVPLEHSSAVARSYHIHNYFFVIILYFTVILL